MTIHRYIQYSWTSELQVCFAIIFNVGVGQTWSNMSFHEHCPQEWKLELLGSKAPPQGDGSFQPSHRKLPRHPPRPWRIRELRHEYQVTTVTTKKLEKNIRNLVVHPERTRETVRVWKENKMALEEMLNASLCAISPSRIPFCPLA